MSDTPINCDPDARRWAKEFNEALAAKGIQPIDPDWMLSWFANAIMCGVDTQRCKMEKELDAVTAERDRYRDALRKLIEHIQLIVSGDIDVMIITEPYGINGDDYTSKFARCKHGAARYQGCEICMESHLHRLARRYERNIAHDALEGGK